MTKTWDNSRSFGSKQCGSGTHAREIKSRTHKIWYKSRQDGKKSPYYSPKVQEISRFVVIFIDEFDVRVDSNVLNGVSRIDDQKQSDVLRSTYKIIKMIGLGYILFDRES